MIKGIIFDVGDILYSTEIFHEASMKSLKKYGVRTTFKKVKSEWDKIKSKSQALKQTRHEALVEYGLKFGVSKDDIEKFARERETWWNRNRNRIKVFPEVLTTLKKLHKKGYQLAILSDTSHKGKSRRKYYNKLGFGKYFRVILTSADLRATKPHPVTFNTTIKKMRLNKPEVVFVAHDREELSGARKQKIKTIGFNLDPGAKGDYHARRFSDIYKIVEKIK
jgi:HAD superfamily hydrolase (TIGR01493 family)